MLIAAAVTRQEVEVGEVEDYHHSIGPFLALVGRPFPNLLSGNHASWLDLTEKTITNPGK